MTHWIITNRTVRDGVVDEDDFTTLPVFRIASYQPQAVDADDNACRAAVKFLPDTMNPDYTPTGDRDLEQFAGTARLFMELYQAMANAPAGKGDTLVFLHGFQYSWTDSLEHLNRLHKLYVEPPNSPIGQIVYFAWPSYGSFTKYKSDQGNAFVSGGVLGRLFAKVGEFYQAQFSGPNAQPHCGKRIHLAAHSMGNQVLEAFCSMIAQFDALRFNLFTEVLLLGADADWATLEPGKAMYRLHDFSDRVHVYSNYHDDALVISESTKKDHDKRLGRHGPRDIGLLPPRSIVVDISRNLTAAERQRVSRRFQMGANKMTATVGVQNKDQAYNHWAYLFRDDVCADIIAVLNGESASAIAQRKPKPSKGELYTLG